MAAAVHGSRDTPSAAFGFGRLRVELHGACRRLAAWQCRTYEPDERGGDGLHALALYKQAVFCLQPPDETPARAAIVDAMSVGCIPVLLHPLQRTLWPWHWTANASGALDLAALVTGWPYNASALLRWLTQMPAAEVEARQRAVLRAAPPLLYPEADTEVPDGTEGGAVDALVRGLLSGRHVPAPWQPPVEGVVRDGTNTRPRGVS